MYTKNETVKNWHDAIDIELYEDYLAKLYEWKDKANRFDELIMLLDSLVGNKEFEKFFSRCEYGIEKGFDYDADMSSVPIFQAAADAMNILDLLPYFPSIRRHLIVASSIRAVFCVIQLTFVYYNNRLLNLEDDKVIKTSDIFYYLTFFVEDYDNPNNEYVDYGYDFYKDFFKKARKTYWADKNVKKFYTSITNWTAVIVGMNKFIFDVHNMATMASIYFMVCNAFKNGRDAVTYDDVVVGYLTTFKIIFNDIRPLVYSLYHEDKWGKVNKDLPKYNNLDKSPITKYSKNKVVKNWKNDTYKEVYDEYLGVLCEWNTNVDRLDELIILLDSFVGNKEFETFFSDDDFLLDECFEYEDGSTPNLVSGFLDSKNFWDHIPYYIPNISHKLVISDTVSNVVMLIMLIIAHYNNRKLTFDESKVAHLSDILYYLTFYTEDYDDSKNEYIEYDYEYYLDFFKKARKIYWKDKKAEKLANAIFDFQTTFLQIIDLNINIHQRIFITSIYFMVCNAIKEGRDAVSCDDVVAGYFTSYKLIFNDNRSLIYSLYDENRWGEVSKDLPQYNYLDKSPFDNMEL